MSKRKKLTEKIIRALKGTVEPTGTPGPLIKEFTKSHSHKDRKVKGHVEARLIHPQMKWKEVQAEAIEPQKFYDPWMEPHDGFRYGTNPDQLYHKWNAKGPKKEEIYKQNNKIIKQIKIRRAKLLKKQGKV